jgi:hypothetical protein
MGVDRNLVIEAFLACDRNENLAASYILDQLEGGGFEMGDDEDFEGMND